MTKAFWDLAKAMINATLLLAALCLFLGWQLFASVGRLTDQLVDTGDSLAPIHQDLRGLKDDLGQIKATLTSGTPHGPEVTDALIKLDQRLADAQRVLGDKLGSIDQIAITAAETFAASLVRGIAETFGRTPRSDV